MNELYCQYRCELEEEGVTVARRAEILCYASNDLQISPPEFYDLCKVALRIKEEP